MLPHRGGVVYYIVRITIQLTKHSYRYTAHYALYFPTIPVYTIGVPLTLWAGEIMPRPKSYTPEQKLQVLTLRQSGTPITTIMVLTGLSHGTIQRIIENVARNV